MAAQFPPQAVQTGLSSIAALHPLQGPVIALSGPRRASIPRRSQQERQVRPLQVISDRAASDVLRPLTACDGEKLMFGI